MKKTMKISLCLSLTAALLFAGCRSGGWRKESEFLGLLETDLRNNGLVTIKRPDVWTENRLGTYRQEFEDVFGATDLKGFEPKLNASQSAVQLQRLGLALSVALEAERIKANKGPGLSQFLALAMLENFKTDQPITEQDFTAMLQAGAKAFITQQTNIDPSIFNPTPADSDTNDQAATAADTTTDEQQSSEDNADEDNAAEGGEGEDGVKKKGEGKSPFPDFQWLINSKNIQDILKVPDPDKEAISGTLTMLSPYEVQNQKRAFVQQNHLFRIGNEPDDATRMNGYRLYYMRFMVSVTPSGSTRTGCSAEILLSPTYNVHEAVRDWTAQYVRAMLRDRILRVVEFGLQRATAIQLHKYGKNLLDYNQAEAAEAKRAQISRIQDNIEKSLEEAIGHYHNGKCAKAEQSRQQVVSFLDQLLCFKLEKQRDVEALVAVIKANLMEASESCKIALAVRDLTQCSDETCEDIARSIAQGEPQAASDYINQARQVYYQTTLDSVKDLLDEQQPLPQIQNFIRGPDRDRIQRLHTFRTQASEALEEPKDIKQLITALSSMNNELSAIMKSGDEGESFAQEKNWVNIALKNAEGTKTGIIKVDELLDEAKTNYQNILTARQDSRDNQEKLDESTQPSPGDTNDKIAIQYAHDVALKLRYEYLGMQKLAQLAYDELALEVDYLLGVPNAVSSPGPGANDVGRTGRAISALKKISDCHPGLPENQAGLLKLHLPQPPKPKEMFDDLRPFVLWALHILHEHVDNYRFTERSQADLTLDSRKHFRNWNTEGSSSGPSVDLLSFVDQDNSRQVRFNGNEVAQDEKVIQFFKTFNMKACLKYLEKHRDDGNEGESKSQQEGNRGKKGRWRHSLSIPTELKIKANLRQLLRYFSTENWPIYTFAVAPFSEAENIGRAIDLNNEVQIKLDAAIKVGTAADIKGALEYARATREQLRGIEVNRTVVGLVRGEQNFGWQINPPYSLPVKYSSFRGFHHTTPYDMPSRTYEVFALVAVPGFLRSIDFGVHYDWTKRQRSDGHVIGTRKAVQYLRRYRYIDNRLSYRHQHYATDFWPDDIPALSRDVIHFNGDDITGLGDTTDIEDNLFLGELIRERLELVESSLPLRMMRRVFLPYADVSERMTNTAGVSNLLPQITRVVPHYLPSHHEIKLTIEGKNFDTGRIEVLVGGRSAKSVKILNEKVLVATLDARQLIADLTVQKRDSKEFKKAMTSNSAKGRLHDIEGLVDVTVITPTGIASDVAVMRLTAPKSKAETVVWAKATLKTHVICLDINNAAFKDLLDYKLRIELSKAVKATHATVILKDATGKIRTQFEASVSGKKVTSIEDFSLLKKCPHDIDKLKDKTIEDISLIFLDGERYGPIKVNGKLKIITKIDLDANLNPKPTVIKIDNQKLDRKSFVIDFSCQVSFDSAKCVLIPKMQTGITFTNTPLEIPLNSFTGTALKVSIDGRTSPVLGWFNQASKNDVEIKVELKELLPRNGTTIAQTLNVNGVLKLVKK